MTMDYEETERYLLLVESALNKILLAKGVRDKRMHDKAVRDAKSDAQSMVYPHQTRLIEICHIENLGDELFDWGHIEGDLQMVYDKLKKIVEQINI